MRCASSSSCVSREVPLNWIRVTAVTSPMMATTTMISNSENPRDRRRATRAELLVEVPVSDVGIFAFAAFLTVGSEGVEIVFLAALTREKVLIGMAPGIEVELAQVS